jgi:hypothetical protein
MSEQIYRDIVEQAIAGRGLLILGEFSNNCLLVGDEDSAPTPSPMMFNMAVIINYPVIEAAINNEIKDDKLPSFTWVCDRIFVEFNNSTVKVGGSQSFEYNLADPNSIKQIGDTIVSELANMKKLKADAENQPLTDIIVDGS